MKFHGNDTWTHRATQVLALLARVCLCALALGAGSATVVLAAPEPLPLPGDLRLGTTGEIHASVYLPDGSLIVGGDFRSINGSPRHNLAKLRPDGTLDPTWSPNVEGVVRAVALSPDATSIYVGGAFSKISNAARENVAKLATTGSGQAANWTPAIRGETFMTPEVRALAVDGSGRVYVGGMFSRVNDVARGSLARISSGGVLDLVWKPNTSVGVGQPGTINALAFARDGQSIFIGGFFYQIDQSKDRNHLAKVFTTGVNDGSVVNAWNPMVDGPVTALAVNANTADADSLFVGGQFLSVGGLPRRGLAKVSSVELGEVDPVWNPSPYNSMNPSFSPVTALASFTTRLYVAGDFDFIGGQWRSKLARINSGGEGVAINSWISDLAPVAFDGAFSFPRVNALAIDRRSLAAGGGNVAIGGWFGHVADQFATSYERQSLAIVNDDGQVATTVAAVSAYGRVMAIARQPDGGMLVGGNFTSVMGDNRRGLLRLRPDGSLDSSWRADTDGSVRALVVDSQGSIYAGGSFNVIRDIERITVAKLRPDGSVVATWQAPIDRCLPGSIRCSVHSMLVTNSPSEALLIAGEFWVSSVAQFRDHLVKVSVVDGSPIAAFNARLPAGSATVRTIAAGSGDTLFIGGSFLTVGAAQRMNLAKISSISGDVDTGWRADLSMFWSQGQANSIVVGDSGSTVFVGGFFYEVMNNVGFNYANHLVSLSSASGAVLNQFSPNVLGSSVESLLLWDDDPSDIALFVGGDFQHIGGLGRNNVAKLSVDQGMADRSWTPNVMGTVGVMARRDDTTMALGGRYGSVGGVPRTSLSIVHRKLPETIFANGFQ